MPETAEIVPLYKCRNCNVRMFEKDCQGHLLRCQGIVQPEMRNVLKYFTKGLPEQHARPGGNWKPMHQPGRGRRKGAKKPAGDEDDEDEVVEA
jgi:hypothetical protein